MSLAEGEGMYLPLQYPYIFELFEANYTNPRQAGWPIRFVIVILLHLGLGR